MYVSALMYKNFHRGVLVLSVVLYLMAKWLVKEQAFEKNRDYTILNQRLKCEYLYFNSFPFIFAFLSHSLSLLSTLKIRHKTIIQSSVSFPQPVPCYTCFGNLF